MRFLFDENLSPRLVGLGASDWPGSTHVETLGMRGASDAEIWALARRTGLTIVTKDDDFRGLALMNPPPPKVIWLQVGNMSTAGISAILRRLVPALEAFSRDPAESLLVVGDV